MKFPINLISTEIIKQYNLQDIQHNGWVYLEIVKCMYDLKESRKLAFEQLMEELAPYGCGPCKYTTGLWKHKNNGITLVLCVDDFGIKYTDKATAQNLINALKIKYECTKDWTGSLYCGIKLDWDYERRHFDLSMPNYIKKALHKFRHSKSHRKQHAPHEWIKPIYDRKQQFTPLDLQEPHLSPGATREIQAIIGTCLYYARVIDMTILPSLNTLVTTQSTSTATTKQEIDHLHDYIDTHPGTKLRYHASDMIIHCDSDAVYLVETKARSRVGGFYYLSSKQNSKLNGEIYCEYCSINVTMESAAEYEVGALFYNTPNVLPMIITLQELGHLQPLTPIKTDNTTALGVVT